MLKPEMKNELGTPYEIPLDASLNTDSPGFDVIDFDGDNQRNLVNNGIYRNGYLTEVYQKSNTETYDVNGVIIYYTSSGKKVVINQNGMYVDGVLVSGQITNKGSVDYDISSGGSESSWFSTSLSLNCQDAIFSTSNTIITLEVVTYGTVVDIPNGLLYINEYDLSGNLLNSKSASYDFHLFFKSNFSLMRVWGGNTFANSIYVLVATAVRLYHFNTSTLTAYLYNQPSTIGTTAYGYFDSTGTKSIFLLNNLPSRGSAGYVATSLTIGGIVSFWAQEGCSYITPNYSAGYFVLIHDLTLANAGTHLKYTMANASWATFTAILPSSITLPVPVIGKGSVNAFSAYCHYSGTGISDTYVYSYFNYDNSAPIYVYGIPGGTFLYDFDVSSYSNDPANKGISIVNIGGVPSHFVNKSNPITEIGTMDRIYPVMYNVVSGNNIIILFKTADGKFRIIKQGTIAFSNPLISEISSDVILLPNGGYSNIYDLNTNIFYQNVGGLSSSNICPMAATAGSKSYNFMSYNKYSYMIDLGKQYNGANINLSSGTVGVCLSIPIYDKIYFYVDGVAYPAAISYSYSFRIIGIIGNKPVSPPLSYVESGFNPIPAGYGYNYQDGIVDLDDGSAVGFPGMAAYDDVNFLTQMYKSSFRLYGQQYAFDGVYVYNIPLSQGSSGQAGTPIIVALANGLKYLCVTPKIALFWSSYDNSIYEFNGGRSLEKLLLMNYIPTIRSAAYCTANDELFLQCADSITPSNTDSIVFYRSGRGSQIFASQFPWSLTSYANYQLQQTSDAVWLVNNSTGQSTAFFYEPIAGSTVVPLKLQTSYYGFGSNLRNRVNRIVLRLLYEGKVSSQLTIKWNWLTQDGSGQDTARCTPTIDANGYAIIDYVPPNASVIGGSVGIETSDTSQKIVLFSIVAFVSPEADSQTLNHAM